MTHFNTIKYSEIVFPTKEKQTTALDKSYGKWSGIFLFFCTAYVHGNIEIYIQDIYGLRTFYQIQIAWECDKVWRDESQIIKS